MTFGHFEVEWDVFYNEQYVNSTCLSGLVERKEFSHLNVT